MVTIIMYVIVAHIPSRKITELETMLMNTLQISCTNEECQDVQYHSMIHQQDGRKQMNIGQANSKLPWSVQRLTLN